MKYSPIVSLGAQQDILESIEWYNNEKDNLGFEFYESVIKKLNSLADNPLHYSKRFKDVRTAKVNKYPYLIYFKIQESSSSIIILGVLHTSRNPQLIRKRK
jgi:toxin ParE1/3/4